MADPVLILLQRIRDEDAAFRRGDDESDFQTAEAHARALLLLEERFSYLVPTTPEGAAAKLREVGRIVRLEADALEGAEAEERDAIADRVVLGACAAVDREFIMLLSSDPDGMCSRSAYAARHLRSAGRLLCRPSFVTAQAA